MKSASLRLRLMIYFILVFATLGLASATLSWFETKDKIDEFFDTYQIALARQLASVDWADITADSQSRTDRIIDKLHNAEDEDEALGFAVFSRDGHKIFHDNENGKETAKIFTTGATSAVLSPKRLTTSSGVLSGYFLQMKNISSPWGKS